MEPLKAVKYNNRFYNTIKKIQKDLEIIEIKK